MKKVILNIVLVMAFSINAYAANENTSSAKVEAVRTYQVGADGVRAQVTISGATHINKKF